MSNAFNLSQLANNTNSSGQVALGTGVTGTLPIANGGTNSTATPTNGGVVYGDGTAHQVTAAGTSGYVLTSAGAAAPTWAAASGGGGLGGQTVFASSGTFTIPTGKTVIRVTLIGAGGSGPNDSGNGGAAGTSSSVSSGTQTITTFTATGGSAGGTNTQVAFGANGTCAASDIPYGNVYVYGGTAQGFTCGSTAYYWSPTQAQTQLLTSSKGYGGAIRGFSNDGNGNIRYTSGGGCGGQGIKYFTGLTPGNTITVTVGIGGNIGANSNAGANGYVIIEY